MTTIIYTTTHPDAEQAEPAMFPEIAGRPEKDPLAIFVNIAVAEIEESSLTYPVSSDFASILDPKDILRLLCYCYAQGLLGSKQIATALKLDPQLQGFLGAICIDASIIERFRDDNFEPVRSCLATVLWFRATQKITDGFITKTNKAWIEEEASRRLVAAAFTDVDEK
jgi:hypothetical protein